MTLIDLLDKNENLKKKIEREMFHLYNVFKKSEQRAFLKSKKLSNHLTSYIDVLIELSRRDARDFWEGAYKKKARFYTKLKDSISTDSGLFELLRVYGKRLERRTCFKKNQ